MCDFWQRSVIFCHSWFIIEISPRLKITHLHIVSHYYIWKKSIIILVSNFRTWNTMGSLFLIQQTRYSPDRNRKPNQRSFGIYELLTMISILYRHHSSLFSLLMILYFSTLLLPFGKAFTLTVLVTMYIVYLCFLADRVSFSIIRCPR